MSQPVIEFVCTGNRGRSPVAELAAKDYLRHLHAEGEYRVVSSGTLVDVIKKRIPQPVSAMIPILETALQRGSVFDSAESGLVAHLINQTKGEDLIRTYFDKAVHQFEQEELAYREIVLPQFGLNPKELKDTQDQTVASPDRLAVLSMDLKNDRAVEKLYDQAGINVPYRTTLSIFATGVPETEVENAFGLGLNAYRERVAQIKEEVKGAIEYFQYQRKFSK